MSPPKSVPVRAFRMFRRLEDLVTMDSIWGLKVRDRSRITPRNFACSDIGIGLFWILIGRGRSGGLWEKMTQVVFAGEIWRLRGVRECSTCRRARSILWRALFGYLEEDQRTMSSAYMAILAGDGTWFKDELRARMKRSGLRTDPCIRPEVGVFNSDRASRYLTWKERLVR